MRRFVSRLICHGLLALAVLLQGQAAAAMLGCAAGAAGAGTMEMHGPGAHAGDAGHAAHAQDGHAPAHDHAAEPRTDQASAHPHHTGDASCSACAACCLGTALPPATPRWKHAALRVATPRPADMPAPRGQPPRRLERPPRLSLV